MEVVESAESVLYPIGGDYATIRVRVLEPKRDKAPNAALFVLHDFVGNSRDLIAFGKFFARQGYRVVLPDMPGRGESAWLPSKHYQVKIFIDVFASVFESYRLRTNDIFGVGWGALLALIAELGVAGGTFRRIALFNLVKNWSYAAEKSLSAWKELAERSYADEAELFSQDAAQRVGLSETRLSRALSTRLQTSESGTRLAYDPAIFDLLERHETYEYKLEPLVSALKTPTLLLNSDKGLELFKRDDLNSAADDQFILLCELDSENLQSIGSASVILPVLGFFAAVRA